MMWRNQRGNIGIVAEVLIVILLAFGFLIAVKMQSKPQLAVSDVYPRSAAQSEATVTGNGSRTLPAAVAPSPTPKILQDEIVYTDTGFAPDILQIKNVNRVILFRNKSTHKMWVVSDGYPLTPDLPSLNEGHAVDPGGVYWFAFSARAGVFGYSNYLQPDHRGVIIAR